ncbi:MAG: rane protein [Frankiales bacterium]|nr:rane protein [Frankiales bacterium]
MSVLLEKAPAAQEPEVPRAAWRERILPPVAGSPWLGWLLTLLVTVVGGGLRFLRLGQPKGRIFDEIYYACDAQNLLRFGVEHSTVKDNPACIPEGGGAFVVHPPLGKWLIAAGLKAFGTNEVGWRVAAAVAGTLTIVLVVRIGRRLTGSTLLGVLAGLVISLDGLHFVQSRVAMLDIFLVLFTTAAFACLVADRDAVRRRLAAAPDDDLAGSGPDFGLRPWLVATGAMLGAALATKWSGVYFVAALGLLAFAWEVGARRTAGVRAPVRSTLRRSTLPLVVALLLLPLALYTLSWAGWFASDIGYDRTWAQDNPGHSFGFLPDSLRSWIQYHDEIYGFHSTLSQSHPYQSHPVGWLLLARPVSYYYPQGIVMGQMGCEAATCSREVLAIGTPVIWWGTVLLLVALLWRWLARRDWRAAALLVPIAVSILPWIRDDLHQRTMFLFYALPAVPFMALGYALVAGHLIGGPDASASRRRWGSAVVAGFLALVVVNFAYLYPVLAAQTLPYDDWLSRMWFTSWI